MSETCIEENPNLMNRRHFIALLEGLLLGSLEAAPGGSAKTGVRKRVIVIGAGMSGLAAAARLRELGHEVVVLEGRNRPGGRIHTVRDWEGLPLDHGATWIHGLKGNPLTQMAKMIGARLKTTRYGDSIAYQADGKPLAGAAEERYELVRARVAAALRKAGKHERDMSARQAVERWFPGWNMSAETGEFTNFVLNSELEQEYGGAAHELSAQWHDAGESYSGGDAFFADGYDVLIRHLAKDLDVRLDRVVSRIDWSGPLPQVRTGSETWEADHVLVTLPLGVLKADKVQFEPDLPAAKCEAVAKLGMGVLNKCYLKFPKVFWPDDVDWIESIPHDHGQWAEWVSFAKSLGQPVLLGFNAADFGREIEEWTDRRIVDDAMKTLRRIYGGDVPNPLAWQITRWDKDPFSLGSYSFNPVGSMPDMRKELAKPLLGKLFFAGEATEPSCFGTVHGAYHSGRRAAQEIDAVGT